MKGRKKSAFSNATKKKKKVKRRRACGDVTIGAVFGAITYLQALFIVAAAAVAAATAAGRHGVLCNVQWMNQKLRSCRGFIYKPRVLLFQRCSSRNFFQTCTRNSRHRRNDEPRPAASMDPNLPLSLSACVPREKWKWVMAITRYRRAARHEQRKLGA